MKIRNPHGQDEWTGAWSDKSELWKEVDEEKKKEIGMKEANDGIFFISYADYLTFFYITSICKYGKEGKRSFVVDEHNVDGGYSLIKFSIKQNYN
jgi:hypothetical protein